MTTSIIPGHHKAFMENLREVNRLLDIHKELTGSGPGRRHKVEVLNRSGVLLVVACWEAFVEDLAEQSFDYLLANASMRSIVPGKVLASAAKVLRESQDERAVWQVAGSGWKKVLRDHREATLAKTVGRLNTPRAAQVDDLFERLLGIRSLSASWHWKGTTAKQAQERLDALVTVRGAIAHKLTTGGPVRKRYVRDSMIFVARLATTSSNEVRKHLCLMLGSPPWGIGRVRIAS